MLAIVVSFDAFSGEKMNACFVTINSSEEKHVFQQALSTGKNAGKFEFHELVPENSSESDQRGDWFEQACKKNIRCDIMVISGHFGGSFFGHTRYELGMDELETRSCRKDCKGFTQTPKEVFLLGCNTLASKEEDNRSAAEYLAVLIEDDIPVEQASRIVEQRYGAVGTSFKDSMKRVFHGVPHIYGFHSVGPSGKNIKAMLERYHSQIPDYHNHLVKVELERALALMGEFEKWNQQNSHLAEALKVTYFAQTSGLLLPCQNLADGDNDPNREILNNICKLKGGELSEKEKARHIANLLLGDDFALYLPALDSYLQSTYQTEMLQTIVKEHPSIKENILNLMKETRTGFGKLKIAKLALEMNILAPQDFLAIEKKTILQYLNPPVSITAKDALCSYDTYLTLEDGDNMNRRIKIVRSDLREEHFNDTNALNALSCLSPRGKDLLKRIFDVFKDNREDSNPKKYLAAIILSEAPSFGDKASMDFFRETLSKGNRWDKALSAMVLIKKGFIDKNLYDYLSRAITSNKEITILGYTLTESYFSLISIPSARFKNYEQLKNIYQKFDQTRNIRRIILHDTIFASPIASLPPSEQIHFFDDREWISSNKGQQIAAHFCSYEKPLSALIFSRCASFKFDRHDPEDYVFLNTFDHVNIESAEDEKLVYQTAKWPRK